MQNTTEYAQAEKQWLCETKITKTVQWFDRFLSTCQTHKYAAETFVLKAHETVWCSHWKYYWACPRRKALTWQHKKNQNGAIVPLVPFTMPNPQTCSWDICPKTPLHSMVFALNIIQSVPRVIKWTQAWPWHARLCDHNETAILAHSHTIRKAQSLYQDLCLLAYWVIHQESAGVLQLQPWKKELPAFTFIIGVKIFFRKGTRPLANFEIVYVLHRIITYYLSYLRGWSASPQHQQHLQECYYQQNPPN